MVVDEVVIAVIIVYYEAFMALLEFWKIWRKILRKQGKRKNRRKEKVKKNKNIVKNQ